MLTSNGLEWSARSRAFNRFFPHLSYHNKNFTYGTKKNGFLIKLCTSFNSNFLFAVVSCPSIINVITPKRSVSVFFVAYTTGENTNQHLKQSIIQYDDKEQKQRSLDYIAHNVSLSFVEYRYSPPKNSSVNMFAVILIKLSTQYI